jgi:predicted secreted Zn-dependent protease
MVSLPPSTAPVVASGGGEITLSSTLSTKYYSVTGTTTAQIFETIDRNGPRDDRGLAGSGLTAATWSYRWQPQPVSDGCLIQSMAISLDIIVTLPRHEQEPNLNPDLATKWDQFETSVARHEQTHVDIDRDGATSIREKMAALKTANNCDALTRQVETLWNSEQRAIEGRQNQFHSQEDARIAGLRAPLQNQIDVNRGRIAQLGSRIQALDAQLATMGTELTNMTSRLESLKSQIDGILVSHPSGGLPPDVYAQYDGLRNIYNSLAPSFNQLVAQYNAIIAERNRVAEDHDKLVDSTNQLVDQFNWAR